MKQEKRSAITHTRDALECGKRKYESDAAPNCRASFQEGDRVLLATKTLPLKTKARKLTSEFVGPFTVLKPPAGANPSVVWLETPQALQIQMPVNVKDLKLYIARTAEFGGPEDEPPVPVEIDGHDCWEVEEILAEKQEGRQRKVLVKWRGFSILDASWEPISNMPPLVVQEFRALQADIDVDFT